LRGNAVRVNLFTLPAKVTIWLRLRGLFASSEKAVTLTML
jgi:hypothetical protein